MATGNATPEAGHSVGLADSSARSTEASAPQTGVYPEEERSPRLSGRAAVRDLLSQKMAWFMVPLVFITAVGIWESLSRAGYIPAIILPAPSKIAQQFGVMVASPMFLTHLWTTFYECTVGFLMAGTFGLVLGILCAESSLIRSTLYPYIVGFQVLPKTALAPLFITWFGFGAASKVTMAAAIAFFAITINTIVGLQSYEENAYLLMRSLNANRWQIFTKLKMPAAAPFIFAGLKNGMTLALTGAIVAEFVAARAGLGLLVETYNFQMKIPLVFCVIIVLAIMGLVLYAMMDLLERKIVFWHSAWEKEIL
jgi:NitT/TauT family transport system permease protein